MAPGFNRPPYLVFDYPFILYLVFSFFFLYNLKEIFSKKKIARPQEFSVTHLLVDYTTNVHGTDRPLRFFWGGGGLHSALRNHSLETWPSWELLEGAKRRRRRRKRRWWKRRERGFHWCLTVCWRWRSSVPTLEQTYKWLTSTSAMEVTSAWAFLERCWATSDQPCKTREKWKGFTRSAPVRIVKRERERERERERVETNGHRGEVHSVREVTSVHSDKELKWNSCIEMETISHSERQRRRRKSSSSSRGRGDKKKIARRLPRDLS